MEYLKCSHCGFLNPLTGQYQTFCQHCNKKLENNFADWHKLHPDKSFADFKALFGQNEQSALPQKKKRFMDSRFLQKDKNGKTKVLWGALFGFIIMILFVTVGSQYGSQLFESFFHPHIPKDFLTKEWINNNYSKYGLNISTPTELFPYTLAAPRQVLDLTDYLVSFKNDEKKDVIQIGVTMVKYKMNGSLEGAANGAVNGILNKPGISDVNYTNKHGSVSGIPAILQTGTYLWENSTKIKFEDLVIVKKDKAWQVMVLYPINDSTGEVVTDRVINSVAVKYTPD